MTNTGPSLHSRKRAIRWVTHATWIAGFLTIIGIGFVGRAILVSRGVAVLAWPDAIALFVPFALFHEIPILVFSIMLRRACFQAFDGSASGVSNYLLAVIAPSVSAEKAQEFPELLHAVVGSCVGLVFVVGAGLLGAVLYSGPGGFAEVVVMILAMFPLTMAYELVLGLVGAAIGGLLGGWVYKARNKGGERLH